MYVLQQKRRNSTHNQNTAPRVPGSTINSPVEVNTALSLRCIKCSPGKIERSRVKSVPAYQFMVTVLHATHTESIFW